MTTSLQSSSRNWFDQGGGKYAQFRPEYPPALAAFLASKSPNQHLAVDVGCGSGQLTKQLSEHFDQIIGMDPSVDQLAHASTQKNINYICADAQALPVADGQASLIVAAQAAHWFDLPRFYAEVRRIAKPDAAVALVSYGVLQLDDDLNNRFAQFYWHEIGSYWPAERKLVDNGYADLPFPFEEHEAPPMAITQQWSLQQLLGYIGTWSATKRLREANNMMVLEKFATDLAAIWGDPDQCRSIRWPIAIRLGDVATHRQSPNR